MVNVGDQLGQAAARAVRAGLAGVLLLDPRGAVAAPVGALAADDVRALTHFVLGFTGRDRARVLFAGGLVELELDGRPVRVAVASRCVFVVAVASAGTPAAAVAARAHALCADVEYVLQSLRTGGVPALHIPPPSGVGGAGPAQVPIIELDVTAGVSSPGRAKN